MNASDVHRIDRSQLVAAGLAVAMVVCFVVAVYLPHGRRYEALCRELSDTQVELAERAAKARQLPKLAAEVEQMAAEHRSYLLRLPKESRVPEFLEQVADILAAENVGQRSVVPKDQRRVGPYVEVPIAINFEASFDATYQVLARLNRLERISRIRELKCTASPESGNVQVEMQVVIFYSSADGEQVAADAGGRAAG